MIPQRPLGNTGLNVSALGFGAASIGFADPARESEFIPLLRRALELGINFFDTAPDYRRSEEFLGSALRESRAQVILATKVGRIQTWTGSQWLAYEDWSEAGVTQTIDASLRRLQTDYLDLVQLHSPPMWVLDDGAALEALLRAQARGKIHHIGISADGIEARRAVELGAFATLQISYSILQQEPGDEILPAASARGIGIIVKQPLANGIPNLRERPAHPDWARKWDIAQQMNWDALDAADDRLALALQWAVAHPAVSTAIVGTTHLAHLEANVQAATAHALEERIRQRARAEYAQAREKITREQI